MDEDNRSPKINKTNPHPTNLRSEISFFKIGKIRTPKIQKASRNPETSLE